MSLQELSLLCGVSVGMISQIERDIANPSARVLRALRSVLRIEMEPLFQEDTAVEDAAPTDPHFVRRAAQRPFLELGTLRKELLTTGGQQNLQMMILHIEPKGDSSDLTMRYASEKAGLVLQGELLLTVNTQQSLLRQGDSFAFDGATGHAFRNPGQGITQVLWIICVNRLDRHV